MILISLSAGLLVLGLALASVFQALRPGDRLASTILRGGRVALSSGTTTSLGPERVLDGDRTTATALLFPGSHPQGTFLLVDLALSHFPDPSGDPNAPLIPRRPLHLRIFNGPCQNCDHRTFQRSGRIKRARLELLKRRANDPDVEFEIPPTQILETHDLILPDSPAPVTVEFQQPPAPPSDKYPGTSFYIICKLTVLEIYPGSVDSDIIHVRELEYVDEVAQPALQGAGHRFHWKP